jgi:hypothetical protein
MSLFLARNGHAAVVALPPWQAAYPCGVMEDSKRVDAIFSNIAIGDEVYASSSSAFR